MTQHLITTTNAARRRLWQRLFHTDALPVKAPAPRWQCLAHGMALAYDLDTAAMHPGDRARLAAYVSRQTGRPYLDTLAAVADGWPIVAVDCVVVETPEPAPKRSEGSFGVKWRAWWRGLFARKPVAGQGREATA